MGALWGTHMHTPKGCALMGWVPYPPHMGPRFAGPITALRAFKKKNSGHDGAEGTRSWKAKTGNSGQNTRELGENMRLHVVEEDLHIL